MNKEEKLKSIINSYSRKRIPPFSIQENALIEYEKFCLELIQENKRLEEIYINAVSDYEHEKFKNQTAIEILKGDSNE